MRRLQSIAIGHFGWSPEQFWRATPHDYFAAVEAREREAETRRLRERNR